MLFLSLILALTACAIGFTSATATPHALARWSSRHRSLQPFQKRASGQFTYFAVGMGACGKSNTPDDFVSIPFRLRGGRSTRFTTDRRAKHSGKYAVTALDSPFADAAACINSRGLEGLIVSR